MKIAEIHVTYPDLASANELADRVIQSHQAACVHIMPIHSIYIWKDEIQKEMECLVIIKTSIANQASLILEIKSTHPYELPALTYSEVNVSTEYGAWVSESVHQKM
jgi:periplasmic divalent cation tolerance protein